jgi:hypothetical protein
MKQLLAPKAAPYGLGALAPKAAPYGLGALAPKAAPYGLGALPDFRNNIVAHSRFSRDQTRKFFHPKS